MAPTDVEAMVRLVKGLRLARRSAEVRAALRAGLFRNPRCPRFRELWSEYQTRRLVRKQRAAQRPAPSPAPAELVLLPFVGSRERAAEVCGDDVRVDAPAAIAPPHFPRAARRKVQ
jgi:hypothetical protein